MKTGNRAVGLFTLMLVSPACVLTAGCYDASALNAFLQKPRSPVSGLEYRVLPPDMISIASLRVPELDGFQTRIRPDGKINLPLLGELDVADKTPKEIEAIVSQAAKKFYEEVDATVQVVEYNSRKFFVFGQVARPGRVPWTGCDTLLDVLAQAQPTTMAWPERILVVRGAEPTQGGHAAKPSLKYKLLGISGPAEDEEKTNGEDDNAKGKDKEDKPADAGNAPRKITINLMAMVEHGDMAGNILLKPNDVVYVQANPFAKAALAFETVLSPVRALTYGLSDYRQLINNLKWIREGQEFTGETRGTFISR